VIKKLFALAMALLVVWPAGAAIAVEISQRQSSAVVDEAAALGESSDGPDERVLWRLLQAKKYRELKRQLAVLQQHYPAWKPPSDLLKSLQAPAPGFRVQTQAKKTARKPQPSIKRVFLCEDLPDQWRQAEWHLPSHPDQAIAHYHRLISHCPFRVKQQTLEVAQGKLQPADFVLLVQLSSAYLPPQAIDHFRFEAMKNQWLAEKPGNLAEHEQAVGQISALLAKTRDSRLAAMIGWRFFDLRAYNQAADWFKQSANWEPSNDDALYGRLLALEKLGDHSQALSLYAQIKQPTKPMRALAARSYKAKAWQAFDRQQFDQAEQLTVQAQQLAGQEPEITELKAWIAKQTSRYDEAALGFGELYRQTPKENYARPYVQSLALVDRQMLADRAAQAGGMMLREYQRFQAKELYERKQFQSAYQLAPKLFPALAAIDSPGIDGGAYLRYKSGEDGLGRLDLFKAPVASAFYTGAGNHLFKLELSRIQLYSGQPERCRSAIGGLPPDNPSQTACRNNPNLFFSPTTRLDHALEIDFSYRREGWLSPFVRVGTTPIGGLLAPTITFDVGFVQQTEFGHWGLNAYSQPIRQSILSYTGIQDPYRNPGGSSLEWGRVVRTGVKSSLFYRFNDDWNASGSVDAAFVEGKNVEQNTSIAVSANIGRNLSLGGFDYFSVGPSFNYEHYANNLSHFTYGHGGYFSPEHYINTGLGVNFLTKEGRPYVVKGRLSAGVQIINEASSPWFPLNNDPFGFYPGDHRFGEAFDFELKGVWLISSQFQIGAGAAVRKTSGYEDYSGGLFVRYYFNSRKASFSTDLPDTMFSTMY
jgi:tetratricopeptide (TPR) repeat protein